MARRFSMKYSASGLSTRFLRVMMAIGRRVLGIATAKGTMVAGLLEIAWANPWLNVRNPAVIKSLLRTFREGVTTVGSGGSMPRSMNACLASAVVTLLGIGITHF